MKLPGIGQAVRRPEDAPPGGIPRLWGITLIGCVLALGLAWWGLVHTAGSYGFIADRDFRAFYTAGRMLLGGVRESFYDPATQSLWQRQTFPELTRVEGLNPFRSAPFVALPLALVAWLPLEPAYLAWAALNLAALGACCYLLLRLARPAGPRPRFWLLALIVTFRPVFITLTDGQFSLLLLAALAATCLALKRQQDWRAGICLALLLAKPQLLLVPALALVRQRRWQALGGLAAGGAALLLVSLALVGWTGMVRYGSGLLGSLAAGDSYAIHPQAMHTWRAFLQLLFQTDALRPVLAPWLIGEALALGLLLWALAIRPRASEPGFDLQWALVVVVTLLTSPHLYYHDLAILLLPGALIVSALAAGAAGRLLPWLPIAGYVAVTYSGAWQTLWRFQASVMIMLAALPILAAALKALGAARLMAPSGPPALETETGKR